MKGDDCNVEIIYAKINFSNSKKEVFQICIDIFM